MVWLTRGLLLLGREWLSPHTTWRSVGGRRCVGWRPQQEQLEWKHQDTGLPTGCACKLLHKKTDANHQALCVKPPPHLTPLTDWSRL